MKTLGANTWENDGMDDMSLLSRCRRGGSTRCSTIQWEAVQQDVIHRPKDKMAFSIIVFCQKASSCWGVGGEEGGLHRAGIVSTPDCPPLPPSHLLRVAVTSSTVMMPWMSRSGAVFSVLSSYHTASMCPPPCQLPRRQGGDGGAALLPPPSSRGCGWSHSSLQNQGCLGWWRGVVSACLGPAG